MTEIDAVVRAVTPHRGQRGRFEVVRVVDVVRRAIRQRVEAVHAQRERIGVGDGRVGISTRRNRSGPSCTTLNGSKMRAGTGLPFSSRTNDWLKLPTRSSAVGTVSSCVEFWLLRSRGSSRRRTACPAGSGADRAAGVVHAELALGNPPARCSRSCSRRALRGASCKRPARERRSCRTSCFGRVRHGPGDGRGADLGKRRAGPDERQQDHEASSANDSVTRATFLPVLSLTMLRTCICSRTQPASPKLHLDHGERRRDGSHIRPNAWSRSNRLSVEPDDIVRPARARG